MNEILNLHVPAAKWIKVPYKYECWIDEHHRIDFYCPDYNVGFEVANDLGNYAAEEKVAQILEYQRIIQGNVYCLYPRDRMSEYFQLLLHKCNLKRFWISPKSLIPNYRHFITKIISWDDAIAQNYPNLHAYKEIGLGDF